MNCKSPILPLVVWLAILAAAMAPARVRGAPTGELPQTSREVSLEEYVGHLRSASAALDGENLSAIHDVRKSLPGEWIIQQDGQAIHVKTDWLVVALLAEEKAPKENAGLIRRAQKQLAALRESAEAFQAQAGGANLKESHAHLERILSGREFQGSHEPSWYDKLKTRIFAWISRQMDKLFNRIGVSARVGNAIAWILVTLAAVLLSLWAVRSVLNAAARAEIDLRGALPAGHDWRYWAGLSRAAADRSDYRAAIHAAYWMAVSQLEERRLLPEDRSRTPRESLRLVKRDKPEYAPLAQLTRSFEVTWYGYHAASLADWDAVKTQLETLEWLRNSTRATANS